MQAFHCPTCRIVNFFGSVSHYRAMILFYYVSWKPGLEQSSVGLALSPACCVCIGRRVLSGLSNLLWDSLLQLAMFGALLWCQEADVAKGIEKVARMGFMPANRWMRFCMARNIYDFNRLHTHARTRCRSLSLSLALSRDSHTHIYMYIYIWYVYLEYKYFRRYTHTQTRTLFQGMWYFNMMSDIIHSKEV